MGTDGQNPMGESGAVTDQAAAALRRYAAVPVVFAGLRIDVVEAAGELGCCPRCSLDTFNAFHALSSIHRISALR